MFAPLRRVPSANGAEPASYFAEETENFELTEMTAASDLCGVTSPVFVMAERLLPTALCNVGFATV